VTADDPGAAAAGSWTLGDRPVHRIGFGAMRLAGAAFDLASGADRDRVVRLLRRAVELGVNHIDTAAFYPSRASGPQVSALSWANEFIRRALAPYPADLVIATKVGPGPGGLARPDQLRAQVEANLRGLGRDHLDVVNLRQHGLDSIAEHFGALADLRAAGLIRHLGVSNIRPHHLGQALSIAPVVCVQNRYGVDFGRVNDELLLTCGAQGIAFVPFFALAASGREAGGVAGNDAVLAVAQARGVRPAQVRIAWTLHRGAHVLAIPGTGDPDHLRDNVAAGALRLSAAELASLNRSAGPDPAVSPPAPAAPAG
jgi:pyridoxine 4-dehydrogenase